MKPTCYFIGLIVVGNLLGGVLYAQSVCLPTPRLLTTMPMGGQAGTEFEITIAGQYLDDVEGLVFSNPLITAKPKLKDDGSVIANQFVVSIAEECGVGVYDARVMAGLGISSARAFSVGRLPEVTRLENCTSLETAMKIQLNTTVNASLVDRCVDHYVLDAREGQRLMVECVSQGIDSKMNPVVVIADSTGSDLIVERRSGFIDFTIPEDGRYVIKIHDLTFKGGEHYFYRLRVSELDPKENLQLAPATRSVASYSWPPNSMADEFAADEIEPNNHSEESQSIELPCDISGSFYPAADVDSFEFSANGGEVWWVEVASERLGRPTDPSVVVQRVVDGAELVDVVELTDIPSPVKRSSNGYSYDGPPYNAGSSDVLGKFEIKEDGVYRIRLTDLFGGTRNDPANQYRMIVRKAAPDFALVGWAMHMGLRNGDRNALSKPIALRGGAIMPIEIVVFRRDGFDGEIELGMENLPDGVTATGLKIGAGKTRGIMLISAHPDAPRGLQMAKLFGSANINGEPVVRNCELASMTWPVVNAKNEIPSPRLMHQIPVSVGGIEQAGLSITASQDKVWEAQVGQKLTIPLTLIRRGEFSGKSMSLQTFGDGFERAAKFDFHLGNGPNEAVLDLAKLKTPPGDYTIAFFGGAVAKYGYQKEKPKDIVDIYVSQPITIRVASAEATAK